MSEPSQPEIHFVFSAPRSGSTWLATALNFHPSIFATENRFFGMFCEIWQNRNGRSSPRITADKYFHGMAQHSFFRELGFDTASEMGEELLREWLGFLAGFLASRSGKRVIVDKVTPYLGTAAKVIREIRSHFPGAAIIHLQRDGRDVATSGVFDWLGRVPDNEMDETARNRDRYFLEGDGEKGSLARFFDDRSLETWARYWTEPFAALASSDVPDAGKFPADLAIRYEDMLVDQPKCLRQVFERLGVDDAESLARECAEKASFERTTGRSPGSHDPLGKSRRGVSGDWRNWFTRADAGKFNQLAGKWLIRSGYAKDDSWVDECPETLDSNYQ